MEDETSGLSAMDEEINANGGGGEEEEEEEDAVEFDEESEEDEEDDGFCNFFPSDGESDDELDDGESDTEPDEGNAEDVDPSQELFAAIKRLDTVSVVREILSKRPELVCGTDERGYLPIHCAVIENHHPSQAELVQYLAEEFHGSLALPTRDANPRFTGEWVGDGERLAIHLAAMHDGPNQLKVVRFLADACPWSLSKTTRNGFLPVHQAFLFNAPTGVARLLLERMPDSVSEETKTDLLQYVIASADYAKCSWNLPRFVEKVDLLIAAFPASLRTRRSHCTPPVKVRLASWFHTPLQDSLPIHFAVWHATRRNLPVGLVGHLVEKDPESLLERNGEGELPLHIALSEGSHYIEQLLRILLRGRPESALVAGKDGELPLPKAIKAGDHLRANLLIKLAPKCCRVVDARGRTPMHIAASESKDSLAGLLIKTWPKALLHRDTRGYLPLHGATAHFYRDSSLPTVEMMLNKYPETIRAATEEKGRLPLHLAVTGREFWESLVQLLLCKGPEALKVKDAGGNLPLFLAVQNRNDLVFLDCNASSWGGRRDWTAMVRCLVEPWPESLRVRDAAGNLLLFRAAENLNAPLDLIYYLVKATPDLVHN